ncbi:cfem protein [Fusarium longipes]|uniref:Cfem protein n=1 Tax=Fusarium longipes TaxID=694270 RepID=A0A395RTN9_9HYPO|nr:cfem protein [Fusarium longipes]
MPRNHFSLNVPLSASTLPNLPSPDATGLSGCIDSYSDSISKSTDPCNDIKLKNEIDNCFARHCSDFERFTIAKAHANACAVKPKDNRFDHYILLLAEVPAWISVWLRLYSSWVTYERLALDDYVMTICGLIYTVFIPLVHLFFLGAFALAVSGFRAQLLVDFFTNMQPVWKYHDRVIWMDIEVSILILWTCWPVWQFFADSDSSDIEVQNQSTLLITSAEDPKKRATNLKSEKTATRSTGFLGMLTRSRTKKPFAPVLHLGDKTYGNVRTEIQGGQRFSMISQFTGLIGIQVKTRTVRRVEDNEWDTEKGAVRENIKAND